MKKPPPPVTPEVSDPADTLAAIAPVARSSVVDAVSDRLRNEILAGRIAPGSRLPSERELSLALGVNRLTLRAALARLEAMGLVSTRHGSGTEVVPWRERAGLEALTMVMGSLEPEDPGWHELLASLLEVRRVLVSEAVALAAERHTDEDLVALRALGAKQKENVGDALAFARGDLAIQRVIVRAAKNVGFELILNTFGRFPEEQPELLAKLYDRQEESLPFYEMLVELVKMGDGEQARQTLRAMFNAVDEDWLARHGYGAAASGGKPSKKKDAKSAPSASSSGTASKKKR